jgi:hypothetical protein
MSLMVTKSFLVSPTLIRRWMTLILKRMRRTQLILSQALERERCKSLLFFINVPFVSLCILTFLLKYPWQPKLLDEKQTTIYKRAMDKNYHLKIKASRFIYSEISQKFPIMPFTARFASAL